VRFGLGYGGERPVLFDLTRAALGEGADASGLATPRTAGLAVTDWQNDTAPRLAGNLLALKQYERSRSLAIAPDAARFVLGTEWSVRAFDAQGREQWQRSVPARPGA